MSRLFGADAEIEEAQAVPMSDLRDPAADEDRVQKAETLVLIGVCTRTPRPLSFRNPFAPLGYPRWSRRDGAIPCPP